MTRRYELRSGKFGMYFYDTESVVDLSLESVLEKLNRKEEYKQRLAAANKGRHINRTF